MPTGGNIQDMMAQDCVRNFRHLKQGDPVLFASEACLIVRRPGMACGLCRESCPVGVISGGQWSIAIEEDGCVGCGLCAAACPTGALAIESFTPHSPEPPVDRVILECRRVASADRDPNAIMVPCLGGLTTPDLIDLIEDANAPIVLSDRGWCLTCPVGRCDAPWQTTLDETKFLLAAVNTELRDRVSVERNVLPVSKAVPVMQALRPDKQVGRRGFLQRLVRAATSTDAATESRRVVMGRGLVTALKRERILESISSIAAGLDQELPATLMPAIEVADACELHGLCSAICPTGALRQVEAADTVSLQFDAARCITCGECQRVCPGKALSLWPAGLGVPSIGTKTLVTSRTFECAGCGIGFVPKSDETFCPQCQKSMDVLQEIAALKFRGPAPSKTKPGAL